MPLTTDDLKQASLLLQPNIIAFITQLFDSFVNRHESLNASSPPFLQKKESTALEKGVCHPVRFVVHELLIDSTFIQNKFFINSE